MAIKRPLREFAKFGDENGFDQITTPLFPDQKADDGGADDNAWSRRLGMVRRFAVWLAEKDDQTEGPSGELVIGIIEEAL